VDAELTIAPPEAADEKVELDLELTLSGVNEEQSFSSPSGAKPLEALFQELGVNPAELLEATQGGGLNGLLEGITGGSSSGGGSGGDAFTECLQNAKTPADLQKCASLRE
jgi:outer membrane receptor protein involved in Fe transport